MSSLFFVAGCVLAFLAVALGAFGAHGLKNILDEHYLAIFETGVRYQMYHAFALFAVAYANSTWPSSLVVTSGWLFVAGTLVFSGSLYVLSIAGIKWLGAITPIGGVLLLAGWASLAWAVYRQG